MRKDLCLLVLPRVLLVFHSELEAFTCWRVFYSLPGLGDEKGSLEKSSRLAAGLCANAEVGTGCSFHQYF